MKNLIAGKEISMGFQHLSKRRLKELGSSVGRTYRTEQLEKAWNMADQLRKQFRAGRPAATIAKENDINLRSVYRIVRGK